MFGRKLNEKTRATIQHLESIEWFWNLGKAIPGDIRVVSTWKEALKSIESLQWDNLRLEIVNRTRTKIRQTSPKRLNEWNLVVDSVKKYSSELVAQKTKVVVGEFALPKRFQESVDWDILNLLMESEYSDLVSPGFYAGLAYWYASGHLPCGWSGNTDGGKLVVF